ncbi:MAG: ATP-binding protein [Myxococcota bacterium]
MDSSASYRKMFELCNALPAIANKNGRFIELNESWSRLLGWTTEELCADPFVTFIHPDDVGPTLHCAAGLSEPNSEVVEFENRYRCRDGSYRWLSWHAKSDGEHIYCVAHDITARKEAQLNVQRTLCLLQHAERLANVGVWELDARTQEVRWSEQVYRIHEVPITEKPPLEEAINFYAPQARPKVAEFIRRGLEHGIGWDFEMPLTTATGRNIWVRSIGSAEVIGGSVRRLFGVFQDISKAKQTEAHLEDAREAALQAARSKSEFLASMSHELRTPMNGVIGAADLLSDSPLSLEQRQHVDTIQTSGRALMSIIDDVLDLCKIQAGKLDLESATMSPEDIIAECTRVVRNDAARKRLALAARVGPDVPHSVLGDPARTRQVLLNLLSNAIKFTEEGEVRISVWADDTRLVFEVSDTGCGIEPGALERIFGKFEQGDRSTTRRYGGTGLGLSISRRLAGLMGGALTARSTVGQGATFRFEVPLELPSLLSPLPTPPSREADDETISARILVAEDHPVNRMVVTKMLQKLGHEVITCNDGACAVTEATSKPFDLVLMDCHMPELDGFDATTAIREAGVTIPIIALTASVLQEDRIRARATGMDDFLAKPVNLATLREMLSHWLNPARRSGAA